MHNYGMLVTFCLLLISTPLKAAGPSGVSLIDFNIKNGEFSLIMASDPQFPWMEKDNYRGKDKETVLASGLQTNRHHVMAMNAINNNPLPRPLAVVINGDLTAFGHPWQWELFREYYYNESAKPDDVTLKYPIFPGLGNHDYANNVNDCWGGFTNWIRFYGANGCAINSLEFIDEFVQANPNVIRDYDKPSAAYSWDIGPFHFVQLNNYPTYERDEIEVDKSTDWLAEDLARATEEGKFIVLNFHDFGDHMKSNNEEFREVIADYNVVAIFVGHIHHSVGEIRVSPELMANDRKVPIFRCGSAAWNLFLHVTFKPDSFVVSVIESANGKPKIRTQQVYSVIK